MSTPKTARPLRKIVHIIDAAISPYGKQHVELECGHKVWCAAGVIYRTRCRQCAS